MRQTNTVLSVWSCLVMRFAWWCEFLILGRVLFAAAARTEVSVVMRRDTPQPASSDVAFSLGNWKNATIYLRCIFISSFIVLEATTSLPLLLQVIHQFYIYGQKSLQVSFPYFFLRLWACLSNGPNFLLFHLRFLLLQEKNLVSGMQRFGKTRRRRQDDVRFYVSVDENSNKFWNGIRFYDQLSDLESDRSNTRFSVYTYVKMKHGHFHSSPVKEWCEMFTCDKEIKLLNQSVLYIYNSFRWSTKELTQSD